ncbi:hypothetical protein DNTS_009941 [Danionella cerebrum]|uniref:SMP-LTD domain-containing protein n=1 Tax=Danionella cerebrum TaxID=2873325 RepID=A0A553Q231_9TELE|nr:hypothetical protein DNTS_009941 [Danionella translucida]
MAGTTGSEGQPKLISGRHRLLQRLQPDTDQRGIVIQLTDTEGEWDNPDNDDELIFTLDSDTQKSLNYLQRQRPCSIDIQTSAFNVPLSPSSPGSLGNSSFLSATHRPISSLVKSLSTELELKESSLKPKPFISLVKSISTELSRSEPEVSQSRSDSKLNLHLWTQFTQPKGHNGDSRTAPPSPVNLSPTEPKASFFKMELEDTRRKLSEAMQEPLSMFSKIMREDSVGSPKHQRSTCSMDSPSYKSFGLGKSVTDLTSSESPKYVKKAEREFLPDSPVRHRKWHAPEQALPNDHYYRQLATGSLSDSSTPDFASQSSKINKTCCSGEESTSLVPGVGLFYVALVSYCYFILPMSAYWSGLFLGLVFGLILGLVLIHWGSIRHSPATIRHRLQGTSCSNNIFETLQSSAPFLQGWMNEMYTYDAETYHPSLMHSVYVTLDGHCLRLDYPRNNIPRWATFDEPCFEKHFTHSRIFRLTGSKVFLLPLILAHKRVWNRKYPICICLAEGERAVEEGEIVEKSQCPEIYTSLPVTLYLFGRTGREKEEWFHQLNSVSVKKQEENPDCTFQDMGFSHEENPVSPSQSPEDPDVKDSSEDIFHGDTEASRVKVNDLVSSTHASPLQSPYQNSSQASPIDKEQQHLSFHEEETPPVWLNALIGRIFWDFLHEQYWADKVKQKIQKKLSKIRLPYFMDELSLTDLAMGSSMPQITGTSQPQQNSRGLWLHLEVEYTGALQMTLETKINLSKLGKEGVLETEAEQENISLFSRSRLSVLADSDEESSSAGSSDEEDASIPDPQGTLTEKTLMGVEGYSFCETPKLDLRVRPKLGEREVTFCHVTEWIEKKLQDEFQKVFVLPNMDDIYLPLMHSGMDSTPISQQEPMKLSQHSCMASTDRCDLEPSAELH